MSGKSEINKVVTCVIPINSTAKDLNIAGSVCVYGKTTNVDASDDVIIYGVVEGNCNACNVTVSGSVIGNIQANNVTLRSSADVHGTISASSLRIDTGCRFSNKVFMLGAKKCIPINL